MPVGAERNNLLVSINSTSEEVRRTLLEDILPGTFETFPLIQLPRKSEAIPNSIPNHLRGHTVSINSTSEEVRRNFLLGTEKWRHTPGFH